MRSKLLVPGARPELFDKAMASSADGVSFDLEDAVATSAKDSAPTQLARYLSSLSETSKVVIVRGSAQDTVYYREDLEALVGTKVDIINLPKVESAAQVRQLADDLQKLEQQAGRVTPIRILANIESPRGVRHVGDIASADARGMGLQPGFADLLEPLGIDRREAWMRTV